MQAIRRFTGAALVATAAAGLAVSSAHAAGIGPGTGPSTFTLETLVSGASSDPRVMMLDQQNALVAFNTYATLASGQIRVCKVGPVPASACAAPGPILTPGTSGAADLAIHPSGAANGVYLTNGTANFTELYASTDGGGTFSGPVQISNYSNAEDFVVLPDGNLLLVGRGNDSQSNDLHVAVVSPSGASLGTPGFFLPATDIPSAQRGVAYNGGRYVVMGGGFLSIGSSQKQIAYAVYSGAGDPNALANWTTGTLPTQFGDPPNIADGPAGVVLVTTDDSGSVVSSKLSGTTFATPARIGDNAGSAYLPNVTANAQRYTATWQVNGVGLRMSQSTDGVHWTAPITINKQREFDTDTATASAGNGLAVTRGGSAYIATRIYGQVSLTLKASPKTIAKGKQATLTATLHDGGGSGISGQKITFKAGSKTVGSGTTNGSGKATLKVAPSKSTSYTASFAGSGVLASYGSKAAKVTVSK